MNEQIITRTGLHLCYLSTPVFGLALSMEEASRVETLCVRWFAEEEFAEFVAVAKLLKIQEGTFFCMCRGTSRDEVSKRKAIRLYFAAVLHQFMNEVPIGRIQTKFGCDFGTVLRVQESALTFVSMLIPFCKRLNWDIFSAVLEAFKPRWERGVKEELLPLLRISGLTPRQARALFNEGLASVDDIVSAGAETVFRVLTHSTGFSS